MNQSDFQIIGKIVGAHSKHGELKVMPITADIDRFLDLSHCFYEADLAEGSNDKEMKEWNVTGVRLHKGNALVAVKGISKRSDALSFKGRFLYVPKDERIQLDDDQFFLEDLIGCQVCEVSKEEQSESENIGMVSNFVDHGGNSLLQVKLSSDKLIEVPFVDVYVADIQIDKKVVFLTEIWRDLLDLT